MKFLVLVLLIISVAICRRGHHYGNPNKENCKRDEEQGHLGDYFWCSANCDDEECPEDIPSGGENIEPECIIRNDFGMTYCAIVCHDNSICLISFNKIRTKELY